MVYNISKYLVLFIFLTGCAQLEIASRPKAIRGESCMASPRLQVLQVLENGLLAYLCPVSYPSYYDDAFEACTMKGDVVYMSVPQEANDYVDEQKIVLTKTQCFAGDGTYSYISGDERKRTVRKIKILEEDSKSDSSVKKAQ